MKPEQIKKILDDWGFKVYQRECQQPSKDNYGKEITVLEEWTNEDISKFIYDEIEKG